MHGMWVYTPSCSAILASCMPPKQGKYLNYRSSDYLWSIPRHFKEPWFGIWRGNRETLLLLTLFQTKLYDFSYPFSDLTTKISTPFQN